MCCRVCCSVCCIQTSHGISNTEYSAHVMYVISHVISVYLSTSSFVLPFPAPRYPAHPFADATHCNTQCVEISKRRHTSVLQRVAVCCSVLECVALLRSPFCRWTLVPSFENSIYIHIYKFV